MVTKHKNRRLTYYVYPGCPQVTLFYYLDITDLNMARASLFRHPFALSQLGHFIREAMLAKEARRRPVVVFGPKDSEGYVTAVGVSPKGKDGAFQARHLFD